jgi:hypothetical protein
MGKVTMSTYKSKAGIRTELDAHYHDRAGERMITIRHQEGVSVLGSAHSVWLDEQQQRELAFELLSAEFDIHYDITGPAQDEQIVLTPKRPKVEVGQFYRVNSRDHMMGEYQGNPLVKVVRVSGDTVWTILKGGSLDRPMPWSSSDLLAGPVEVEERVITEWVEKKA